MEVFPNATLVPDWDLLEQIHTTYKGLKILHHSFQWVRGHQDKDKATEALSVEAQYNVRADALAGEYHVMVDRVPRPFTPLLPSSGCILQTSTSSLHGKYTASLRRAFAEPTLFEYLCQKHTWTTETCNEVDWPAFRIAARNYDSTEVHLLKLAHDLLPTRHHVSKFQSWTSPTCYFCSSSETMLHLQKSSCNVHSSQYAQTLLKAVRYYLSRNHAPPDFQTAFCSALSGWFADAPDSQAPTFISDSQARIGWHLLTRGFLSHHWRSFFIQTAHQANWTTDQTLEVFADLDGDEDEPDESQSTGSVSQAPQSLDSADESVVTSATLDTNADKQHRRVDPIVFIAGLIKTMWKELGTLWTTHLETVHQTQESRHSPAKIAELQQRIRHLHSLRSRVLARHRSTYFHSDLEAFLSGSSMSQLQTYISQYQPVILSSIQAAEAQHVDQLEPNATVAQHSTGPAIYNPTTHNALEEAPHRKRNRLRIVAQVIMWVTSSFRRALPSNRHSNNCTPP